MASATFRLRLAYRKVGRLRWLSHLEITRALERAVRRSALPYAVTQGFSPHMRIAFGPALPVGTAGERESIDVWLTRYLPAEEVLDRMRGALPAGLEPLQSTYVEEGAPSLSSGVHVGVYHVIVEGKEVSARTVRAALEDVIAAGRLEVEHRRKTKVFDLSLTLPKEPTVEDLGGSVKVEIAVRMGPEGSLRPEALLNTALAVAGLEGVVAEVTRTDILTESREGVR